MHREPEKEILRIGDIVAWIPGMTEYQVNELVKARTLKPLPYGKHRRFHKDHVRAVLMMGK